MLYTNHENTIFVKSYLYELNDKMQSNCLKDIPFSRDSMSLLIEETELLATIQPNVDFIETKLSIKKNIIIGFIQSKYNSLTTGGNPVYLI